MWKGVRLIITYLMQCFSIPLADSKYCIFRMCPVFNAPVLCSIFSSGWAESKHPLCFYGGPGLGNTAQIQSLSSKSTILDWLVITLFYSKYEIKSKHTVHRPKTNNTELKNYSQSRVHAAWIIRQSSTYTRRLVQSFKSSICDTLSDSDLYSETELNAVTIKNNF